MFRAQTVTLAEKMKLLAVVEHNKGKTLTKKADRSQSSFKLRKCCFKIKRLLLRRL